MPEDDRDEFYVGYQPRPPSGIARLLKRVVIGLGGTVLLAALILTLAQGRLALSVFEYGKVRDLEGVIRERPVPALVVARPYAAESTTGESRYTLVLPGKHGAASTVQGFDGRRVKLKGSLIYRDGLAMIEMVEGSIEVVPSESGPRKLPKRDWLGVQSLVGEIVDSKCYLGVMNPGNATPHRECAIRCISGGVPALFIVRNFEGASAALWLITTEGTAVGREVLDLVAKPLEIKGEVTREGDQLYLRADPRDYRLLGSRDDKR